MKHTQNKGTALITGASSGIGAVYADRLAKRGYDLILVARDDKRMQKIADRLTTETGRRVDIVKADLTAKADLLRVEEILKTDKEITLLINNAGIAVAEKFSEADMNKIESMLNLNVTALTRLTGAAIPGFIARNQGTIINIASIVALAPELVGIVYSGSKAYVLAFTQGLHNELIGKNIHVQAVLPGATSTEIWERAGVDLSHFPKEMVMSTEKMVDAALVGLDNKELITIPSLPDEKDWEKFNAARLALGPNLSRSEPAARYKLHS